MAAKMAAKLAIVGALIVTIASLLHGHDILTAVAMLLLFLVVLTKIVAAFALRPPGGSAPGNGGDFLGLRMPRPPGGRPPALSSAAEPKHESLV